MDEKLPQGWTIAKVNDIADVIEPGFPYGKYNTEGLGIPHLRPMNIDGKGRLSLDEIKYVNIDNPPLLHSNDILFNNTNSPVWVGKTTVITQGEQYTFSNHMTRVTVSKHAGNSQFFALQLQFMQQSGYFLEHCIHHVNQASIASSYLAKNVDLLVAPLPEQHRIVATIEQQFTRLDSAVASLQSARERTKQYRASLLKAAVEGELTKDWRAEHPASETGAQLLTRILKERRARWEEEQLAKMREKGIVPKDSKWKEAYKEPQGPSVEGLPELPERWCWVTVGHLAWSVKDGPHYSPKYVEEGIPFITAGNVRPTGVDFVNAKRISLELNIELSKRCKPEKGDILYTKGGTTGIARVNTYNINFNVWVHVAVLKIINLSNSFYMQHALNSELCYTQAQKFTHGVGNQDLGLTRMVNIVLPLPPFAEQEQIVSVVEERLSIIQELEATIEANLKRAEHERQSILREAFAGRLVEQDPEDEPASILLERMLEERKRREEAEKELKKSRKGDSSAMVKRRRGKKAEQDQEEIGLHRKLIEVGKPLPPDDLFKQVGLKTEL